MKSQSDYHDQLSNCSLIPVELLGKRVTEQKKDGRVFEPLILSCCFFDAITDQLFHTNGQFYNPGDFTCAFSYKLRRPAKMDSTLAQSELDRAHWESKGLSQGMKKTAQYWWINPEAGRVFNRNEADRPTRVLMNLRNVGQNGFGPGIYTDPFDEISPHEHVRDLTTKRLAEANPIADSWFLIA